MQIFLGLDLLTNNNVIGLEGNALIGCKSTLAINARADGWL